MVILRSFFFCFLAAPIALAASPDPTAFESLEGFFQQHCYDCHDADSEKAGLNLESLGRDLENRQLFEKWVLVHDRVAAGEMPPEEKPRPDTSDLEAFLSSLSATLHETDQKRITTYGRATKRRLNRYEYENALRELLHMPNLSVRDSLPEDPTAHHFNKIGDALDMSYVQLSRYLEVSESALRQAIVPQAEKPPVRQGRYYAWDERAFWGMIWLGPTSRSNFPLVDLEIQQDIRMGERTRTAPADRDEERKDRESVALMVSNFEPINGRFSNFRAPVDGTYRLRLSAQSVLFSNSFEKVEKGLRPEPVYLFASSGSNNLRPVGVVEALPERSVQELEVWLRAGETIHPDAARLPRIRPPDFANPLALPEGRPGVAFGWLEVEGPFFDEWPTSAHRVLFGDLPVEEQEGEIVILPNDAQEDAARLLRQFMERAYRRAVTVDELSPLLRVVHGALDEGYSFVDAMIAGYSGVLSSPAFIYLNEDPGPLGPHAVADRMAFFLWNGPPDEELLARADDGRLLDRWELLRQTERMLEDPRSGRFVEAFLDYWLDLRHIRRTAPDPVLYPDYQLNDVLEVSMLEETRGFFEEMLRRDLGARYLIDSDFTILNEMLAEHYGLDRGGGPDMRLVTLPADSPRGGLLTQASVLKVTADGNNTSPVVRGVWIMERILGMPPPPPPPTVPAVEPDTSGATTIREQLAAHSSDPSCITCHRKIDPVGFSLESFDVMGGFREFYRSTGDGEPVHGVGHNGLYFQFSRGQPVDASGELWDGRTFRDVRELKQLLSSEEELLARNLASQLITYATGAPISFGDRPELEAILKRSQRTGYGVRTLVHEIIQSPIFLHK